MKWNSRDAGSAVSASLINKAAGTCCGVSAAFPVYGADDEGTCDNGEDNVSVVLGTSTSVSESN